MVDTQTPRRVKDIYIQWKPFETDYKTGEIIALLFLVITAIISILAFFGDLPFLFYIFFFPVSKLHVDWRKDMPMLAELTESLKGFEWDSSAKFALFVTSIIGAIEIGIVLILFLLF
ncbi:MAG: hypothetical protein D6732_21460 [Methanobacteriota archaeon]|nr:MAG: hypothetical protein D6732_21460 [Euryarchaeota archaeon]